VFNPYSGVKTSILILDRAVAKTSDSIAFFKIENDGFGLGAQRRALHGSQLPQVKADICAWLEAARGDADAALDSPVGFAVEKKRISEDGEFNLSGERYRATTDHISDWPHLKIGDVCKTSSGGTPSRTKSEYYVDGTIPWLTSGEVSAGEIFCAKTLITEAALNDSAAKIFPANSVLIAMYGATAGEVGLLRFPSSTNQAICALIPDDRLLPEFLFQILRRNKPILIRYAGGGAQPNISQKIIKDIEIPMPPLEVQREIVSEVEGFQKVIDGARAVLENYRPHIAIDRTWPVAPLANIAQINPKKSEVKELPGDTLVSFVPMAVLQENRASFLPTEVKPLGEVAGSYTYFRDNDVLLAKVTPCFENGKAGIAKELENGIGFGSSEFYVIRAGEQTNPRWLFHWLTAPDFKARAAAKMTGTGGLQRVPRSVVEEELIPLPPYEVQQSIVAEIEAEQALVEASCELIARFEKKIDVAIARVWGGSIVGST
jgi:restriction endonuclease S subunit